MAGDTLWQRIWAVFVQVISNPHRTSVEGFDQSWLENEVNSVNIIILLILFYGNVFHVYIHDVIIIRLTYDSSKIPELVCLNENERKDLSVWPLAQTWRLDCVICMSDHVVLTLYLMVRSKLAQKWSNIRESDQKNK